VGSWLNPAHADFLSTEALKRAHEFARKAVQLDRKLPQAHVALGWILAYQRQHDDAIAAFEKAESLNPNYVNWRFGMALVFAGDAKRAIELVHTYMRLDPFYVPYASLVLAYAQYMLEQYSEAQASLRDFVMHAPHWWAGRSLLAASLAKMGQLQAARAEAAETLRLAPNFTISRFRPLFGLKYPHHEQHLFNGLRQAGLPE
jgi:adenylate cyclase